jgi:hypothetical protein
LLSGEKQMSNRLLVDVRFWPKADVKRSAQRLSLAFGEKEGERTTRAFAPNPMTAFDEP